MASSRSPRSSRTDSATEGGFGAAGVGGEGGGGGAVVTMAGSGAGGSAMPQAGVAAGGSNDVEDGVQSCSSTGSSSRCATEGGTVVCAVGSGSDQVGSEPGIVLDAPPGVDRVLGVFEISDPELRRKLLRGRASGGGAGAKHAAP